MPALYGICRNLINLGPSGFYCQNSPGNAYRPGILRLLNHPKHTSIQNFRRQILDLRPCFSTKKEKKKDNFAQKAEQFLQPKSIIQKKVNRGIIRKPTKQANEDTQIM